MAEIKGSIRRTPRILPTGVARRLLVALVTVVVLVLGFSLGRYSLLQVTQANDRLIGELKAGNEKLASQVNSDQETIKGLQTQLADLHNEINDVFNTNRTFQLNPNDSKRVSVGYVVLSLIGSPANEKVSVNISGKQQPAAVGDIIHVSATCNVEVQSFDMFKATMATGCTLDNPDAH